LGGEIFGDPRVFSYRSPAFWLRSKYSGEKFQRIIERVVVKRLSPTQQDVGGDSFISPDRLCKTYVLGYARIGMQMLTSLQSLRCL